MLEQVSGSVISCLLGIYPVELLDHMAVLFLGLKESSRLFSLVNLPICYLHEQHAGVLFLLISSLALVILGLWITAILVR